MIDIRLGEFHSAIERISLQSLHRKIEKEQPLASKILIVTDETVAPLLPSLAWEKVILPAGEAAKHFESVQTILKAASQKGLDRDSLFVGIGGGVICDVTAFAASLFMRGSRLFLVPTTLLAMVDASIGGKTGIDYEGYKNQIGTFYPASKIFIIIEFLKTLPEVEWRSGLGEVIKSAFLKDAKLLKILETQSEAIRKREEKWTEILIFRSIRVKAHFIQKDFKEKNIRAYLNLGHTFAHALESFYACQGARGGVSHGEAVAWGIKQAAWLAYNLFPSSKTAKNSNLIEKLLSLYDFKSDYQMPFDSFLQWISRDKKNCQNRFRLVIQKAPQKTMILSFSTYQLKEALKGCSALTDLGETAKDSV